MREEIKIVYRVLSLFDFNVNRWRFIMDGRQIDIFKSIKAREFITSFKIEK